MAIGCAPSLKPPPTRSTNMVLLVVVCTVLLLLEKVPEAFEATDVILFPAVGVGAWVLADPV